MPKFEKGNSLGKGRPKGSKNKLAEDFLGKLANDFKEHGEKAIQTMRQEDNTQYVKTVASLIPKDMNIDLGESANQLLGDTEAVTRLVGILDAARKRGSAGAGNGDDSGSNLGSDPWSTDGGIPH